MTTGFILLAAACAPTTVENRTTENWTSRDQSHLVWAVRRCEERFPESPCVRSFRKNKPQGYRVICGAESED